MEITFSSFLGIILGLASFAVIGIFHPIVIKSEYYFTEKCWPVFLIVGIICCVIAVFIKSLFWSALIAIFAFSCFWSIGELKEQTERVRKGWFPENPNRKNK